MTVEPGVRMRRISHNMLAWAPWAISLPRRIPRSRRITITCFGSIPTLPDGCIATEIRTADLQDPATDETSLTGEECNMSRGGGYNEALRSDDRP